MERRPFKRKSDFDDDAGSRKKPNNDSGSGQPKMSFAQRMMAKMGYKEGEGLGKTGTGMLEPIEVKVRPQNAGLGAVREKTEQAKREERRQAERRGDEYEDSSEEERKARRKRQAAPKSGSASGVSTPGVSHPKTKYRTAADFEAAAVGLTVPSTLKSIIDATGKEHKTITTLSGLMTPTREATPVETEADKLAKKARRDLESFTESWKQVEAKKKFIRVEDQQLQQEMGEGEQRMSELEQALEAVEALEPHVLSVSETSPSDLPTLWEAIISLLQGLQEHHGRLLSKQLPRITVATIQLLFKRETANWDPLKSPTHLVSYLELLHSILEPPRDQKAPIYEEFDAVPTHKATTLYESLIYTFWLPKVRAAITNWNVYEPDDLIPLINAWEPLLPSFITSSLTDDLIVKKLTHALNDWNPRLSRKEPKANPLPHEWLFPWLPLLEPHHSDPKSSYGLVSDIKRKFRVVLDSWNLHRGVIPGLKEWRDVLGDTLRDSLITHLLPRLASLLDKEFEVNPVDQDVTALERVFKWQELFTPKVMGQLIATKVFPKLLTTLHAWLTGKPDYEEVGQWIEWWKEQIPQEVNEAPVVKEQWNKVYQLINDALDIVDRGENVEEKLVMPSTRVTQPLSVSGVSTPKTAEEAKLKRQTVEQGVSFKDVVEQWCEAESLLMVPLREAHPANGLPLFRITASANGKGGAVAFLKGDVVWARQRGTKDQFDPVELGQKLIDRAEAK